MTGDEINKYVHRVISRGKCWQHNMQRGMGDRSGVLLSYTNNMRELKYYKDVNPHFSPNPNYLEHGKDWGELLNWAVKQDWWSDFIEVMCQRTLKVHEVPKHLDEILNLAPICVYETGAEEIIKYLFTDPKALATGVKEYLEGRNENV